MTTILAMKRSLSAVPMVAALALLSACATASLSNGAETQASAPKDTAAKEAPSYGGLDPASDKDPFPSTYKPMTSSAVALVGATIFTGTGARIDGGMVLLENGKITAVGKDLKLPAGAKTV